jgi:hypothetical protein
MLDHAIPTAEEVQHLGQSPDEIGQQCDALARQEAEATRIALECRLKRAKLLLQVVEEHGYKGRQYVEFAHKHGGASRTDAYDMLLLKEAADDVLAPPEAATNPYYEYPHWRTVFRAIKDRRRESRDMYWITPDDLAAKVRQEVGGDYYDPCPFPLPPDHDALAVDLPNPSYLNPPFCARHEKRGRGLTAFARHAIEQAWNGTLIKFVLPVPSIVNLMLEAGATVRSLSRVRFRHAITGEPNPAPRHCAMFTLLPLRPRAANDNERKEST